MEDEKKLYPLKTMPVEDGNSSVLMADLGYIDSEFRNGWLAADTVSEVMEMYMDRVVGENVFAYYGRQFPVMLRVLDVSGRTELMVHPDDATAAERYDFLGKAKLWYVLSADTDAGIFLGFGKDVGAADFYMACRHSDVEGLLNRVEAKPGDSFFIAPGTVHAACGKMKILEVAECSPLDFRVFNWGKEMEVDEFDAELNLDAAFDFIDYKKFAPAPVGDVTSDDICRKLVVRPEFEATEIRLADPIHMRGGSFDNFLLYSCACGMAELRYSESGDASEEKVTLGPGEAVLVPAEVDEFRLVPCMKGTVLMEVSAGRHDGFDPGAFYPEGDEADAGDENEFDGYSNRMEIFS